MNDAPQFLIEWPSPWREFTSAIVPALRRSPPRMRQEAQAGLFPLRGILLAMLVELAALATAMVYPSSRLQPVAVDRSRLAHDVIYFSADELPRTADLAGAESGRLGKRGGGSLRTPRQVIRVARDQVLRDTVMDAPQLQLPKSESLPANLLAYKADAGPAPAESLKLKREAPVVPLAVVPPPAEIPHSEMRRTQLPNSAVAPPPIDVPQHELARRSLTVATAVVPPPVSAPAQVTSARPRLTLPTEAVAAPRPEIGGTPRTRQQSDEFTTRVVAPPVEVSAVHTPNRLSGLGGGLAVVPPPVTPLEVRQRTAPSLGNAPVVAPPVDLGSVHQSRTVQAANIAVAPPPTPSPSPKATGDNTNKGSSTSSSGGIVLSPTPGNKLARPANSEKATLAMAPSPNGALGAGGSGGGGGLSRGTGPGTSPAGTNSGAAATGTGKTTSGTNANGSSPYPGPGGSGMLTKGSPRVPGVSVSGGSNVVTLPSFGATPDPHASGRSTVKAGSNAITVVASPRSGGAMNLYGAMKGDRVYTIYISTSIGQASMQFADPDSAANPSPNELTAPTPIRMDLPSDLAHGKMVVRYVLDRSGALRNPQVLNSEGGDFEPKLLAALSNWKFSPALRGSETIEVNVILGFGVNTN